MRKSRSILVRLLVATPAIAVVAHLGCSSKGSPPPGETSGDDSGAPDSAAVVEEAGAEAAGDGLAATGLTLTWKVNVQSPEPGNGQADAGDASANAAQPVPGVAVCVNQMPAVACTTTDSTGTFTLAGLPASTDIVVTLVASGYHSLALAVRTSTATMNALTTPIAMSKTSDPDPSIGVAIDWADAGQVQFFALGSGAFVPGTGPVGDPGTSVTLMPAGGVGPLFLTDQNTFDAAATTLIDVAGAVYNVAPGNYTLTFDDPTGDCEPIASPFAGWGYPGSAHDVTLPVLQGFTTTAGVYCTKNAHSDGGADAAAEAASADAGAADGSSDAVTDRGRGLARLPPPLEGT
jgi:hypothetical protein